MSILNPFSSGEDDGPDSPEEEIEFEESQIISDLESLQNAIEDALEAEMNLFRALKQGLSENVVEDRVGSIEIYIEDDVEPREKSIRSELEKLRDHEGKLQASKPLVEEHQRLLEVIQDAVSKTDEEIQRLEQIVEAAEKVLKGENFSHDEMMSKIENKITTDAEEAEVLEDELETAEDIETDIRQS
ncbi:hypothetical protein ACK3SF_03520 [Candidatus Nanosalina sp. VS9-1]|uniref:hypothetical protein n=1 Tax=Candidatus Nanosalina sp. VS9-1 TaxID=3388566 RepID=UPI0039DFD616